MTPPPTTMTPPTATTSSIPPAVAAEPVRLRLRLPALLRAGVGALLEPHHDRVAVLPECAPGAAHVEVFDPLTHGAEAQQARLDGVPLVALVPTHAPGAEDRARRLGATQVLPHSVSSAELLHTLERTHREGATADGARLSAQLSPREAEILGGICRGMSNAEIAGELYLSINSIKTYVRLAYRKIGVSTRAQAVIWGLENGF